MGAVSALVDMNCQPAARALLQRAADLEPSNRRLAISGLVRNKRLVATVVEAMEQPPPLVDNRLVRRSSGVCG
jgi:hypothetical protein